MPGSVDHYALLAISRTASSAEVKAAYRRLALRLHPDVNAAPEAAAQFGRLAEAYRCLSDPDARRGHDLDLATVDNPAISVQVAPEADDGPQRDQGGDQPADDVDPVVPGDPAEVSPNFGVRPRPGAPCYVIFRVPRYAPRRRLKFAFERRDPCRRCGGIGLRPPGGADEDVAVTTCPTCWGKGHLPARRVITIAYRSAKVLGGVLVLPHEGNAGDHGGPRGNLTLNIVTPDHTVRGLIIPAFVAAGLAYALVGVLLIALLGC